MASKDQHVVVWGAGVIGLTSALFLAEAGYAVTVIAAHTPGDEDVEYTSPWAGAHWRTHAKSAQPRLCAWDTATYDYWTSLIAEEQRRPLQHPPSGLNLYQSFHYWDEPVTEDLWWAPYVRDFRDVSTFQEPVVSINATRPDPATDPRITSAASCTAMSCNVPRYLAYLQTCLTQRGGVIFKHRLPTDGDLPKALQATDAVVRALGGTRTHVTAVVNATGLGAAALCHDTTLFPIRGQTVLIKGEAAAIRTRYAASGDLTYCIPRPGSGTTILGGTREVGDWSGEVREDTTREILRRCARIVPELLTAGDGGFEVVSVQCGLRPGRKDGPRVEREVVDVSSAMQGSTAGKKVVVHAYGHAGAGYQNSVGCAREVVRLVGSVTDALPAEQGASKPISSVL